MSAVLKKAVKLNHSHPYVINGRLAHYQVMADSKFKYVLEI